MKPVTDRLLILARAVASDHPEVAATLREARETIQDQAYRIGRLVKKVRKMEGGDA